MAKELLSYSSEAQSRKILKNCARHNPDRAQHPPRTLISCRENRHSSHSLFTKTRWLRASTLASHSNPKETLCDSEISPLPISKMHGEQKGKLPWPVQDSCKSIAGLWAGLYCIFLPLNLSFAREAEKSNNSITGTGLEMWKTIQQRSLA